MMSDKLERLKKTLDKKVAQLDKINTEIEESKT
jgi:hypothetical protein